jgi:phospholipase D1/2
VRAHVNREKFRVYVVLPLLPGFSSEKAVQAVLYFIMRSINKGKTSLYQRLKASGRSTRAACRTLCNVVRSCA